MTAVAVHTVQSTAVSRRRLTRAAAIAGAMLTASVLYLAGRAAGADFVLSDPGTGETSSLTLVHMSGVAAQCGLLGWAVLALLERLTRHARTIWTALAAAVLALSFAPIWLLQVAADTRVMLMIIHVAVAAALLPMLRPSPSARRTPGP
ncbi:DUF6069 family protein [Thermomonospora cellulosilytica]|uniref:Uncharacterized protein n=1 Tax=Thermomonospora cellulosilytica TaxID=1411118 RepID=A0A7W3MX47_9ACTN|nr:DUF6069 family protein [Thermomonospora cellulosilytica]MBA9003503.1 hypothetical protein [Thermomonospora cellulosilytica]